MAKQPPYLLWSDSHFHAWSAFSDTNEEGINTRLAIQLDEARRAYDCLIREGGNLAIHAGDLFHVRGQIKHSVINPVRTFFKEQSARGVETAILSGNHDLESNDATDLTSAVTQLRSDTIAVINEPVMVRAEPGIMMVPWHSDLEVLRQVLTRLSADAPADTDLIIHAPMNDVLMNIPSAGLCATEFEAMNFNRVFSGHYHNHKQLSDNVWSVGATTHQTWSDVGTKAGFCLVYEDEVRYIASQAPSFMPLGLGADESDLVEVDGNYVRADISDPTPEKINTLRDRLKEFGAVGVVTRAIIETKTVRSGKETVSAMDSLEDSINNYAKEKYNEAVAIASADILREVREV